MYTTRISAVKDIPTGRMMILLGVSLVIGLAGSTSYDTCKGCFNSCSKGKCDEFGCKPGYYGSLCKKPCPTNCANGGPKKPVCNQSTGNCLSGCTVGYHGLNCTQTCPKECTGSICTQHEGICVQGCMEPHHYGARCQETCNKTCTGQECDRNGLCYSCKAGYWGLFCENRCNRYCLNNTCFMDDYGRPQCSEGCVDGWTGSNCDIVNMHDEERTWSQRFRRDTTDSCYDSKGDECSCCRSGYKLMDGKCKPCENCRSKYDKNITPACLPFCKPGHYYTDGVCNKTCPTECNHDKNVSQCKSENGNCHNCPLDFFGDKCQESCSSRCLNNSCYQKHGRCVNCNETRHGRFCDEDCNNTCKGKLCDRVNGSCSTGCTPGWQGFYCNNTCSDKCVGSVCSLTIYGRQVCTYGCIAGYWGDYCTDKCLVDCTRCNRGNGTCVDTHFNPSGSQPSAQSQEDSGMTSLELGLIAVVLIVAIAFLVSMFMLWRYHGQLKRLRRAGTPDQVNIPLTGQSSNN